MKLQKNKWIALSGVLFIACIGGNESSEETSSESKGSSSSVASVSSSLQKMSSAGKFSSSVVSSAEFFSSSSAVVARKESSSSPSSSSISEQNSSESILSSSGGSSEVTDESSSTETASRWESCTEVNESCFEDTRDGRIYRKTQVGTQTWMAQNLNFAAANSLCYGGEESNCEAFGKLYSWSQAMAGSDTEGAQGVCPAGWHLPTKAEWETLAKFIESEVGVTASEDGWYNIAPHLKASGTWQASEGVMALDSYGFSAKAAGHRYPNETYGGEGLHTFWWTSSKVDDYYAHRFYLENNTDFLKTLDNDVSNAFSVRCLLDQ